MKHKTYLSTIFLISLLVSNQPLQAQTCTSGKLDSTVVAFLKKIPADNRTLEELRKTTNFENDRKGGPPATPYPQTDVVRTKITADSIPILVFNPLHTKGLPIIIHYHGGGFVVPITPWMESIFWSEAKTFNAIVVAVDYRVAPEYKFPAAVDDCYEAFEWISEHGHQLGGDPNRIIVMGESSGANLVAVICQKAKQAKVSNRIKLQVMNCPPTDSPDRAHLYPSMQENANGYLLTTAQAQFATEMYATKKDYQNPALAPIRTNDLSGLPPAVILTAEFDPIRDQGAAYAEGLKRSNVKVWYACYPGQIHCFLGSSQAKNKEITALIRQAIQETLGLTALDRH